MSANQESAPATGGVKKPVRFVVTRRAQNCSSASCLSRDWFVRSLKISRPIFVSNHPLWWLFRRLLKLIWWVFSKIPTCAPSTPSVSPSCQRTSNLLAASVVNVPNFCNFFSSINCELQTGPFWDHQSISPKGIHAKWPYYACMLPCFLEFDFSRTNRLTYNFPGWPLNFVHFSLRGSAAYF